MAYCHVLILFNLINDVKGWVGGTPRSVRCQEFSGGIVKKIKGRVGWEPPNYQNVKFFGGNNKKIKL